MSTTVTTTPSSTLQLPAITLKPTGLNHYALATNDMETTHKFWTEVLNCKYLGSIRHEDTPEKGFQVAKTGNFLHNFYSFGDGSAIAFFELENDFTKVDDGVPGFAKHLALGVNSHEELQQWHEHLSAANIPVLGEINHDDIWHSIYFMDPNGQQCELTYQERALTDKDAEEGLEIWKKWRADKTAAKAAGHQL
jgi:glyoxylase I family protein